MFYTEAKKQELIAEYKKAKEARDEDMMMDISIELYEAYGYIAR